MDALVTDLERILGFAAEHDVHPARSSTTPTSPSPPPASKPPKPSSANSASSSTPDYFAAFPTHSLTLADNRWMTLPTLAAMALPHSVDDPDDTALFPSGPMVGAVPIPHCGDKSRDHLGLADDTALIAWTYADTRCRSSWHEHDTAPITEGPSMTLPVGAEATNECHADLPAQHHGGLGRGPRYVTSSGEPITCVARPRTFPRTRSPSALGDDTARSR